MGGKKVVVNTPKPDYAPMLKVLEEMRKEQRNAASESARMQEEAISEAQNNAAQLGMNQANAAALQELGRMQQFQQAEDAAALGNYQAEVANMGRDVAGGPIDVNAANQAALANAMGAGYTINTPQQMFGFGFDYLNPATWAQRAVSANKFQTEETNPTLGGK